MALATCRSPAVFWLDHTVTLGGMKYSLITRVLTSSALAASTVVIVGMPSGVSAATTEEIADSLLQQSTEALGIEISDEELLDELSDGLEYAIEDGSIPEDVTDEIGDDIDSGTDSEDTDATLEGNIIDQITNWEEYAPMYRDGFELVRADFQACRAESGSARTCAQGLGFRIQVAIAEDSMERIQLLVDQLTDPDIQLTDEEQAALQAELEELQAKIDRAKAKLERLDSSDPAVQKAKKDMERIRAAMTDPAVQDVVEQPAAPGKSGDNGNAGGNGNGKPSEKGNSGNGKGPGRP